MRVLHFTVRIDFFTNCQTGTVMILKVSKSMVYIICFSISVISCYPQCFQFPIFTDKSRRHCEADLLFKNSSWIGKGIYIYTRDSQKVRGHSQLRSHLLNAFKSCFIFRKGWFHSLYNANIKKISAVVPKITELEYTWGSLSVLRQFWESTSEFCIETST